MSSKEINLEKGIIVLKRRGLISRLRQPKRQKKKKKSVANHLSVVSKTYSQVHYLTPIIDIIFLDIFLCKTERVSSVGL